MSAHLLPRERIGAAKFSTDLVSVIGRSVPLRRDGPRWVGVCPFHSEKTASFYVFGDHYHCYGCQAHGDIISWCMHTQRVSFGEALRLLAGGVGDWRPVVRPPPRTAPEPDDKPKRLEMARRIWIEATDPHGTPVEAYLASRGGLQLPDEPVIRFHPACPHGRDRLPAMITKMVDPLSNEPCSIHRTFIRPDGSGKVDIPRPKMMLGGAGVIRLYEPVGEGLGVCEGVEDALTISQVIEWGPCWSAGSAGGIERLPALLGHSLTIFADPDAVGLKAARACAARWNQAGQEARVCIPPAGRDWNAAIMSRAS